jgi:hypothetical protein
MISIRLAGVLATFIAASTVFMTNDASAQQKYTYTISRAPSSTKYLQQHAIDVDDVPGHQVRVYEIHYDYPNNELAFAGVSVKESLSRGMSDYVNSSGPFTAYNVYTLEDGNKVYSRSTGTSLLTIGADGNRVVRFSGAENFVGGTGKFKGIHGQAIVSGERAVVAKSLTQQSTGEYWIEE